MALETTDPFALVGGALRVLRRLDAARFAAPAALAQEAGLTPGDVGQALDALENLGVELVRDAAGGMALARPYDALDPIAITRALAEAAPRFLVAVRDTCSSTNSDILLLEDTHLPGRMQVLTAELQTAGRGRRGRGWVSGLGTSLTFSVLRRFGGSLSALSGLSLAAGLAVAQALEELGAQGVRLKWPNDILLQRDGGYAKLGGILIELSGEAPVRAVIGIGLNVRLPAAARAQVAGTAGAQPVADLGDALLQAARNRVLAGVLRQLAIVLDMFEREGFVALRGAWNARHAYQGAQVSLSNDGRVEKTGTVEGVDAGGALRLATAQGMATVVSGDLSLRPLA